MKMGKVISVCNQKGGVGKTTTTVNLAVGLALRGRRILTIDLDPQGNLSDYLGWEPDEGLTIMELMLETSRGNQLPNAVEAIRHNTEGVDFLPADIRLSGSELFLTQAMFRETVLKRSFLSLPLDQYDYILIDCPPSLGPLLTNALIASDSYLVPVQAQKFALSGIDDLQTTVRLIQQQANPKLSCTGFLLTMADRTNMAKAVEQELRERFPLETFQTVIHRSVEATNSTYLRRSLVNMKNSALGLQYVELANEVLKGESDNED